MAGKGITHTLLDWNSQGFRIAKGAKHIGRTPNGTPLFSQSQVYKKTRRVIISDDDDPDYDDPYEGLNEW